MIFTSFWQIDVHLLVVLKMKDLNEIDKYINVDIPTQMFHTLICMFMEERLRSHLKIKYQYLGILFLQIKHYYLI